MTPIHLLEPMAYELPLDVKRPARYLGSELHAARSPQPGDLRVGLAFPDLYEVGMSHLGLNLLYSCVNQSPGLFSERVFMPDDDLERFLRGKGIPLTTLETKTPLHRLDVLGFSLAYELTYTNVLGILDLGSIPLRSEERSRQHPIVIAGGPCAFNPEPLASFIDAFVIGEAEFRLVEICRIVKEWKASRSSRQDLLRALDRLEGVYVPSLFEWRRGRADGRQRLVPLSGRTRAVRKCEVPNLDEAPYPHSPIVPFARIVHDRIGIEAARGCPHACRFCQAGNLYRPYRERSPERVREIVSQSLERTGYEQISLLALSIGDYSCLGALVGSLMEKLEPKRVSLSLPSLRVGSLEPCVVEQILRVRKTGFTLAPEAATTRLRGVVNKRISEEELMRTAHLIARLGWRSLKLYFMIGLPTETDEEVEEIVRMAQGIRRNAREARNASFHLTVNVSSFVPKAHTPLQWMKQQALEDAEQKQRFLQGKLRQPAFRLKWHDARLSLLEGLFARGGRELGELLEAAYRLGCRRDGWSEHLRFDLWQRAFEQTGVNPVDRLDPYPDPDDPLPWDWIDTGMPREWFRTEHRKAMAGECSDFACSGRCEDCGLCVKSPRGKGGLHGPLPDHWQATATATPHLESSGQRTGNLAAGRYRLQYVKRRPASYLSHLETLTVFHRALRRSQLPIHYTGGEHPHPKVAFSQALPLGVESRAEYMDLWLSSLMEGTEVEEMLNAVLPEGICVVQAMPVPLNVASLEQSIVWMEYEISFPQGAEGSPSQEELEKAIAAFHAGESSQAGSKGEAGKNDEDLRRAVQLVAKKDGTGLVCRVHRLSDSTPSAVRVVESLFPFPYRNGLKPRILKTEAALLAPHPPRPVSKRKGNHDK
jgi:radical SAM family uncharacterized protein/radical SAM-linked protein